MIVTISVSSRLSACLVKSTAHGFALTDRRNKPSAGDPARRVEIDLNVLIADLALPAFE
jgi:hypothetical protein